MSHTTNAGFSRYGSTYILFLGLLKAHKNCRLTVKCYKTRKSFLLVRTECTRAIEWVIQNKLSPNGRGNSLPKQGSSCYLFPNWGSNRYLPVAHNHAYRAVVVSIVEATLWRVLSRERFVQAWTSNRPKSNLFLAAHLCEYTHLDAFEIVMVHHSGNKNKFILSRCWNLERVQNNLCDV